MSTLRVNTIQNSGGTGSPAINGLAAAWVNFNGTGTVAIRGSNNVSSITDNGTGDYTVNFINSLADTNYSVTSCCQYDQTGNTATHNLMAMEIAGVSTALQTSSARVWGKYGASTAQYDMITVTLAFFR